MGLRSPSRGEMNSSSNLEAVVAQIAGAALSDKEWKNFGFSGRPKSGAFWKKLRPAWKVNTEHRLMRLMLQSFSAVYMISGRIAPEDLRLIINAFTSSPALRQALGLHEHQAGEEEFIRTIDALANSDLSDWPVVMIHELSLLGLRDADLVANFTSGSIAFSLELADMIDLRRSRPDLKSIRWCPALTLGPGGI